MFLVVLTQEVLAVVVSIRSAHDAVDVLASGRPRQISEGNWQLVIELDEDNGALHPVIKNTLRIRSADPGEPSVVEMTSHFLHLHLRVSIVHISNVLRNQSYE